MRNIVYLVNHLGGKGPIQVLYSICKFLDRSQYHPVIVTFLDEKPDVSIADKFKKLGIEIRCIHSSYVKAEATTSKVARLVENAIKDLGDCIVHPHCYHPTIVAAKMSGYKTITTIHNISIDDFTMKHGKLMGTYLSWRFRRDLKKMDCAVALSDYMKDYYQGCSDNLIRIYNGVDYQNNYSTEEVQNLRKKLDFEDGVKVVLVCGSLTPRKNPLYAIEELKKSNRNDFLCVFIGSGVQLEECKAAIGQDRRFRFEGQVNNVKEYLAASNISMSVSKSEGLPLGVLEALSMGVPMILSDIAPHREIAGEMGTDSIKVVECKEGKLLPVLEKMLDSKFDRKQLQEKATHIFGAQTMASKYMDEYKNLMSK